MSSNLTSFSIYCQISVRYLKDKRALSMEYDSSGFRKPPKLQF